jgi:quercetin dioxygenase-like cupin family protein
MRIHTGGEASEFYGGRFTGAVRLEMLQAAEAEGRPDIARVAFAAGACSYWHSHPGGQQLLVLTGTGRVGTAAGEVVLQPGDFVDAPADERHYHGAATGADCVFLAVTYGTTAWEDRAP